MSGPLTFGNADPGILYVDRPAAYVVVIKDRRVAVVVPKERAFLPGGGMLAGEPAEETAVRETLEELGLAVQLVAPIGQAVQYFYSPDDDIHYKMLATFFTGHFEGERSGTGENELRWLPREKAEKACFHPCHAWAIRQCFSHDPQR